MDAPRLSVAKTAVLARAGPLLVSAALPGWDGDPTVSGHVREALMGASLSGLRPTLASRVLAAIYGGVLLTYDLDGRLIPLSRALPEWPVSPEEARDCEPAAFTVDGILRLWAELLAGEPRALEVLGRCTIEPAGLRLAVGRGEPLPAVGFSATP